VGQAGANGIDADCQDPAHGVKINVPMPALFNMTIFVEKL
jgi:hypothetical protein